MSLLEKYKENYIMYSQTLQHKRKVQNSIDLINKVLNENSIPYLSFSTGKDSLCMLHLVYTINPDIVVMFHDSGVELPESYTQIKKIEENWGLNLKVVKSPINVLDKYKEKDGIFTGVCENIAFAEAMGNPIKKFVKNNNFDLSFIGLRKQESKRRKVMLCTNSNYFYCKSYQVNECFPLSEWKKEDVWAYIYSHYPLENLIHPAYYKDRLVKDPGDIRISWFCDPTMATRGSFLWLKLYYPNLFTKLAIMSPEIKSYI